MSKGKSRNFSHSLEQKDREQSRAAARMRNAKIQKQIETELDEEIQNADIEEDVEKSFDTAMPGADIQEVIPVGGPVSFEEIDEIKAARNKAHEIREATWDVQDLVRNIVNHPGKLPNEKADLIKKVGADFGTRVSAIMDTSTDMMKELDSDLDLLQAEALLAIDKRNSGLMDALSNTFQKAKLTSQARKNLPDSAFALVRTVDEKKVRKYPIHDKAHVRNALARAAQQIKDGGASAASARAALPKIRAEAKKMGIDISMEKGKSAIMVQKDASGDWRWVGWPSNNFKDRSEDILTEAAHIEFVDWWNKERDQRSLPVFTSMHAPKTARTYPVDFVGYENGFLVMSGKLTEDEAAGLLRVQKDYDLGMSHTGWGIRDKNDPRQIIQYRIYEVTDLPIEMADNPFTDMAVISKEVDPMKREEQLAYLVKLTGSKELAEEALSMKTSLRQEELKQAGVEQKEAQNDGEGADEAKNAASNTAEIIEAVAKKLGIEELGEAFSAMQKELEKIPLLETIVKSQQETIAKLSASSDEQLADLLTPPAERTLPWIKKARASQSDETKLDDKEAENFQKKAPGIPDGDEYWLSRQFGLAPIEENA